MTLAEYALKDRESTVGPAPMNVYCFLCNLTVQKGEPARRYDAATFTHFACPNLSHKTYAAHKYGDAK